jgi:predicted O-linked N-acetylglucosamine transferase (SPINDLY family)
MRCCRAAASATRPSSIAASVPDLVGIFVRATTSLDNSSSSVNIRGGRSSETMMTDPSGTRFAGRFAEAQLLQQQGQLASARLIYEEILDADPVHVDALNAMGVLAGQSKDLYGAIRYFDQAITVAPGHAGAHCNRGLALKQLNQPDAALECFDRAIALDPGSVITHYSRAETYKDLGRADEALASYDQSIALNPGFGRAYYRRGVVLQQIARLPEAIASYDQALQIDPDHFESHANRGFSLFTLGRYEEGLASCERAIALKPGQASLYMLRGDLLRALDRLEPALTSYERAIDIDPESAEAHGNRGTTLLLLNRVEAISSFDRAIEINPEYAEAYFNRGYAKHKLREYDGATADYKVVAALAPDFDFLPGARLESSMLVCDWSDFDALAGQIITGIESGGRVCHPFTFMGLSHSARLQHEAARIWVNHTCPANGALGPITPRARTRKLTIGYFSPDFSEHPVGRLLAELIEIHDRSRFEVIAFSFGPKTDDPVQQRLTRAFDRLFDLRDNSSLEIASLARSLNVDIAVDLCGHTRNNRAGIFALRAAPVQVNYLGYLGTMGANYMDYIVADPIVVTPQNESHFSEKIIYLPDTHQVNDRKGRIADKPFTREELGLPLTGFVFCCFNTNYKILPPTFAGWMRILKAVPGSVLFLYAAGETTETNLRAQAGSHGVDPQRLVFGGRMALPEYLARFRTADLFLDTLPYNAGTTASDALWAGLPVLTLSGEAYVSRTAASLLTAIGAPELITFTQQEYERVAIELASNPQQVVAIRTRIQNHRLTSPLFDTLRFARNLEAAYTAIHDRYQAGLPPSHVRL